MTHRQSFSRRCCLRRGLLVVALVLMMILTLVPAVLGQNGGRQRGAGVKSAAEKMRWRKKSASEKMLWMKKSASEKMRWRKSVQSKTRSEKQRWRMERRMMRGQMEEL